MEFQKIVQELIAILYLQRRQMLSGQILTKMLLNLLKEARKVVKIVQKEQLSNIR